MSTKSYVAVLKRTAAQFRETGLRNLTASRNCLPLLVFTFSGRW